jgi:hypothetical protein
VRTYPNPFRSRTSEHLAHQGIERYLRSFAAEGLDLLPDELWDRLVLIRSAPGGGKTSLLRAVSAQALRELTRQPKGHEDLIERLQAMGVLDEDGHPAVLGFRVPLSRDFRAIVDLEADPSAATRTFLALLDARITAAFCDALQALLGAGGESVLDAVQISVPDSAAGTLQRIGGPAATGLQEFAAQAEAEILDRLDAVLPRETPGDGHGALYTLRALSAATISLDGREQGLRPLLLLDDGHELAVSQRHLLLDALHDRELTLARWYTERYSAMEPEELVGDGEPHRNHVLVELELQAGLLGKVTRRGGKTRRFEKLLADIAGRRASRPLLQYDEEERPFTELLDVAEHEESDERAENAVQSIRGRLHEAPDLPHDRYRGWYADAEALTGLQAARRWREIEILIARDIDRPELGLFPVQLTEEELRSRSDSAIREAADLFLRREFGLPFYAGSERVSKLSAENIEQYLGVCADLFDEMTLQITRRRSAELSRLRQDAALTAASEQFWRDIPARRVGGRGIQQLMRHIATLCRTETYRPKASYAPGVTGTALSMDDRQRLLNEQVRAAIPGAQQLFEALHGAIGHNLLRAELNRSVKDGRWMVLSLNRLTCVRYGLPLGYGGFRERSLEQMCRWMLDDVEDPIEPGLQETFDIA